MLEQLQMLSASFKIPSLSGTLGRIDQEGNGVLLQSPDPPPPQDLSRELSLLRGLRKAASHYQSYLHFRTGGLVAQLVVQNPSFSSQPY
jgi:hypothetical protein